MAATMQNKLIYFFYRRFHYSRTFNSKSYDSLNDIFTTKPVGSTQNVKGWVKSTRKMKDLMFVDINDGSCPQKLQVVFPKIHNSTSLAFGSSVNATGKIQTTPKGQLELFAEQIEVLGECGITNVYPFSPKQVHSPDYCRQYLHLRPRTSNFSALLRLRDTATKSIHDFFDERGFLSIHTPILTANDCEGAGEVFMVKPALSKEIKKDGTDLEYFKSPAYLTVSGQLHLEAICRSISKAYTFNPSFRAENSKSRLHLSEFYMVEAEEAFVNRLEDVLLTMEDFVKTITASLIAKNQDDVNTVLKYNDTDATTHLQTIDKILNNKFTVMSFKEAKEQVAAHKEEFKSGATDGLTKEHELFLVKQNGGVPIFVVDWPTSMKPFYMRPTDHDENLVHAVDLLVPNVGELCGGSLREDSLERLDKKLGALNLREPMEWYLDLRRFGNVSTGGFGMGFERFLQFVLNIGNIKDTIPFPRWPHNLKM